MIMCATIFRSDVSFGEVEVPEPSPRNPSAITSHVSKQVSKKSKFTSPTDSQPSSTPTSPGLAFRNISDSSRYAEKGECYKTLLNVKI